MIKRHPIKSVKVSSLRLPGDIEQRRKRQHVVELGKSFSASGGQPAEPPVVEAGTLRLICGADRIAACLNEGVSMVDVLPVEGTPEALERLSLVENVRRRHGGHDHEIARLLELEHPTPAQTFPAVVDEVADFPTEEEHGALREYEKKLSALSPAEKQGLLHGDWTIEDTIDHDPPLAPKAKPGRPASPKTEAVRAVAKATGKTEAAVRAADYRSNATGKATPSPATACIDTFEVSVPPEVLRDAQEHLDVLEEVCRTTTATQAALTRFSDGHGVMLLRIKEPLHDAGALAKSLMPASVCLWCKCTKHRKGCPGCKGRGWLTTSELKAVMDERLKATGALAGIWVDGKWVKLSEVK